MKVSGKAIGGIARANKLSPEERKIIAKKAAEARWNKDIPRVICGSPDRPLKIGNAEIQCYVLEDETRVFSQRGLQQGIGLSSKSNSGAGQRLSNFLSQFSDRIPDSNALLLGIEKPIKFMTPWGKIAHGYEATILTDICDTVLGARKLGILPKQQERIADQCELLVRGFARVGIIALVDEATGYQEQRAKSALSHILEAFIAKELQPWVQTFPEDFYRQIFRLRGLRFPQDTIKRPQYFGCITNDIVYKRLAPGVLDKLKQVTIRNDEGRPKHKYFQRLTTNIGYPKLREHLGSVVTIMKLSDGWSEFMDKLDIIHPRFNDQLPLPLQYDQKDDSGQGI